MSEIDQLRQGLVGEPDAFCVSWIQRRFRLGYARACALRDEAIQVGMVVRLHRLTAQGQYGYAYAQPGRECSDALEWFTDQR